MGDLCGCLKTCKELRSAKALRGAEEHHGRANYLHGKADDNISKSNRTEDPHSGTDEHQGGVDGAEVHFSRADGA